MQRQLYSGSEGSRDQASFVPQVQRAQLAWPCQQAAIQPCCCRWLPPPGRGTPACGQTSRPPGRRASSSAPGGSRCSACHGVPGFPRLQGCRTADTHKAAAPAPAPEAPQLPGGQGWGLPPALLPRLGAAGAPEGEAAAHGLLDCSADQPALPAQHVRKPESYDPNHFRQLCPGQKAAGYPGRAAVLRWCAAT